MSKVKTSRRTDLYSPQFGNYCSDIFCSIKLKVSNILSLNNMLYSNLCFTLVEPYIEAGE